MSKHNYIKLYFKATEQAHEISDQIRAAKKFIDPTTGRPTPKSEIDKLYQEHNQLRQQAQGATVEITKDYDKYAAIAHQLGIARDTLEVKAGLRKNPLTADQLKATEKVKAYYDAHLEIRQLQKEGGANPQDQAVQDVYTQKCQARNALAYEMINSPDLYQSLFRVNKIKNGGFTTMFGLSYQQRPPSFKVMTKHAQDYFQDQVREIYDRVPDVESRWVLSEKLLPKIEKTQGKAGFLSERLRFEQRWAREHPTCTLESLKEVDHQYEAISQGRLSPDSVVHLCHGLLGTPQLQTREQLRYGKSGSLVISLKPNQAGRFYEFTSGDHGSLLSLIERHHKVTQKDAQALMIDCLQGASSEVQRSLKTLGDLSTMPFWENDPSVKQPEDPAKQQRRQEILAHAVPLQGTVADRYLSQHRGLPSARSDDILFHEPHGSRKVSSMVVVGRNKEGEITCIQETFLDPRTAQKANFEVKKRSLGQISGSYGLVQQQGSGPLILAEGAETALSLKEAGLPGDIYIAFGISNFKHFATFIRDQDRTRPVIIAADNDGENAQTKKQLASAVSHL